jgi:hypothetical protein
MPDGRIMIPSTPATRGEAEAVDAREVFAGPDGRFYLRSEDAKAEKARASDPIEQAGLMAGQPPSKQEVREAKAADKAADKASEPVVDDPAVETVNPDPIAVAAADAGDPPIPEPKGSASKADWERYARSTGATDDDVDGLSRDELRAKYQTA